MEVEIANFYDLNEAVALVSELKSENIDAFLHQTSASGATLYSIQILKPDVHRASELLGLNNTVNQDGFPEHIEQMSNAELIEVLDNRADYAKVMIDGAKALLNKREVIYDEVSYEERVVFEVSELSKGIELTRSQINSEYISAFLSFASILGVIKAWDLYNTSVNGPDGKIYQKYGPITRGHGLIFLIIRSVIFLIAIFIVRVLYKVVL